MQPTQAYTRQLRIAFLDSWLQTATEGSGTAVGISGLEQALQHEGHSVERIAPPATGWWTRLPITLRRLLFNLLLPLRFDARAYDLAVGFDWDGVFRSSLATRHSSLVTHPYICSIKGVIAEELQHEQGRIRFLFMLLAQLEGRNARRADRVITTSEYCRQRIVDHYRVPAHKIGIVPEGIDVAAWTQALATIPPATDQARTILCVARQYPRKHIADLLHAFALIRQRVPNARLRIVGDGPEHARLVDLAQTLNIVAQVDVLGGVPDAAIKREYAHCDVFCLPSVQEGFGIVFLEAMAAGKPIISTTAAAIPEVVQHGITGILLPPGDVHALAGALLLLLTDDTRRESYGAAARAVVERYDWARVADTFLAEVGLDTAQTGNAT